MADKKISQLGSATPLQGDETFAIVQSSVTKKAEIHSIKNYIVPTNLTVSNGQTVNLSDSSYADAFMIRLTCSIVTGKRLIAL